MQNGPLCTCGNRGCVETFCSATWLIKQGVEVVKSGKNSVISAKVKGDDKRVNAKIVLDSAKEGDPEALLIFNQYMDYLSSAIASIAVLLDPETIAIGGGVSLAGAFLFERLNDMVEEKSFFKYRHKIVPTIMQNDAGIVGAAQLLDNR